MSQKNNGMLSIADTRNDIFLEQKLKSIWTTLIRSKFGNEMKEPPLSHSA